MALMRGRFAFLVLFLAVIAGCNAQVGPAPGGGAGNGAATPNDSAPTPSAPVNVPSAASEPAPSGYDFTIWNARKSLGGIELQYRRDGASSGSRARYRLLVEQSGADTIYADLGGSMTIRAGEASKISLRLMFTGLKDGGQGATLRIVKMQGFGLTAGDSQDQASNIIPLEVPAGLAGAGGGGSGSGGSGGAAMAPAKIDPELQMPDDMPRGARDPWATLRQEFGKAKIAVLRLEGGEKVNLTEGVLEKIAEY
jgi:hypothetical protein